MNVIVTGTSSGFGQLTARTLASNGHTVFATVRDIKGRNAAAAADLARIPNVQVVELDVTSDAAVEAAVGDIAKRTGGAIDVLVNNAAIRPHQGFLEMSEAEWQRVFDVNFNAAFWFCRAFLPGMVANGWGRVVSFVGMNAIGGHTGRAHVSASKHAVWGMSKTLAKEFGPKGITVNVISPGTILGEKADAALVEASNKLKPGIPVGRLGTPDDLAAMVSLLASDNGGFINGQMLQINGGVVT